MKAKLIVNPTAGGESALDHLPEMHTGLRELTTSLDVVLTTSEGDAVEQGRRAVLEGCDHLFVAGGDGTLNEVLNGIAQVEGGLAAVTLGVIPLGTGNDFASALGLPEEPAAAVDWLRAGTARFIDVGRMNGRYFMNISAGGFIADVSDAVPSRLKTVLGKLAYLVGGAQVLADFEPVRARVRQMDQPSPSAPSEASLHAFAVCNSSLIGGGRLIAPHAVIDDGWLDVCLIHAMPTLEFLALLRRVSEGDHVGDERVSYFRTRGLELTLDRTVKVNTDGQVVEADRCQFDVLPGAVRVIMRGDGSAPPSSR